MESVSFAELNGGHERHLHVAVPEGMVLDQVRPEHGGLGRKVGIEVLAHEAGSGGVEGRIGQVEARVPCDLPGRHLQDGLGDQEEVRQFEIVDRHVPNRSSALWFWWMASRSRRKNS